MNLSALRTLVRPIGGLAMTAAMLALSAHAASAAVHTENRYCDNESGVNCQSFGYPSDHGWDYGSGGHYWQHGRHHHY
jgi:hypothetical protein